MQKIKRVTPRVSIITSLFWALIFLTANQVWASSSRPIDSILYNISTTTEDQLTLVQGNNNSKTPVLNLGPAETLLVNATWSFIQTQKRVWNWEYDPPSRIAHYCVNECACVTEEIGTALKVSFPGIKIYTLRTARTVNKLMGVQVLVGDAKFIANWDYHIALLVGNNDGQWGVIDPIIFSDQKPHALSEWFGRFLQPNQTFILQKLTPALIQ
ncbi:MAG: hypothetical protein SGI74_11660 [Oligoflexia bacterium]|nr:hypothetical protein [Oligoflexia bacterium]